MKAVRLKYCLNLLLLCANTSEKMVSLWVGHCLSLFCLFGAGYPQIQPLFVRLLQLPPQYILHIEVQDHQQHWEPSVLMETLLWDPLQLMGSSQRMSLDICAHGPQSKRKESEMVGLNRVLDQQMHREQTQSQWLGPDTHTWVTSSPAELEAQGGSPTVPLCLIKSYLLK